MGTKIMQYHTEYRADWTAQTKIKGHKDRKSAERYAKQLSDRKHGTVHVMAWIEDQFQGQRTFYNGELETTSGIYA